MQIRTIGKVFKKTAGLKQGQAFLRYRKELFMWKWVVFYLSLYISLVSWKPIQMVYASEHKAESEVSVTLTESVTPAVTVVPTEGEETVLIDGVSEEYLGNAQNGLTTTVEKIVSSDKDIVDRIVDDSTAAIGRILYYLPYIGIGFFVIGAFIALFSIKNKANRRWGIRMAIVVSVVMFFAYILITLIYEYNFRGMKAEELVKPEQLDYYGELYFAVYEKVLRVEQIVGIADKVLSKNIPAILVCFYAENAEHVGISVFGLGLLLWILSKRNKVNRRWAVCLCFIVPLILYIGYWYITKVISVV